MSGGGAPLKKILPGLIGSFVVSYAFWDLTRNRKIFGGTVPPTHTKEWEVESAKKFDEGWGREAGSPVVLNPIRRQNFRVVES